MKELKVTSPAFSHNEMIPEKYTCDGDDINPRLNIDGVPEKAKSLVLIVDDPDAPNGTWTHWIIFNIDPGKTDIEEDSVPGTEGHNDFDRLNYGGPCPPSGTHRYFFRVYALTIELGLKEGASRGDIDLAIQDNLLTKGELVGRYKR